MVRGNVEAPEVGLWHADGFWGLGGTFSDRGECDFCIATGTLDGIIIIIFS